MEYIDIIRRQVQAYEENRAYALVTIADTDGSATRSQGKMMVFQDGETIGTVGGGAIELLVIRAAEEALESGRGGLRSFDLNSQASQKGLACGGAMQVLIELYGVRPTLVLSGAGHVNSALLPLARSVGFRTVLLDNRPQELIAAQIALADRFVPVTDFESGIRELDVAPGAYFVLAGPNHDCDGAALAGALTKNAAYVGMIGGPRKIRALFDKLLSRGYTQEQLDFVHTPIGLDISGERPAEIAVSILAEVLMVLNGKERPKGL